MREDRMARMTGGTVVVEAPESDVEPIEEEPSPLPSPAEQMRILNPDEMQLLSQIPIVIWHCPKAHPVRRLEEKPKPQRCDVCNEPVISDDFVEAVEDQWYTLRLAFTKHDVKKRHVWDYVDHLMAVLRAEMTRLDRGAQLSQEWVATHAGYLEIAVNAPATRTVIRETLRHLADCSIEIVEGISSPNLTIATMTLMSLWIRRNEEVAAASRKDPTSPTVAS